MEAASGAKTRMEREKKLKSKTRRVVMHVGGNHTRSYTKDAVTGRKRMQLH